MAIRFTETTGLPGMYDDNQIYNRRGDQEEF
jgi:hypothetical protein